MKKIAMNAAKKSLSSLTSDPILAAFFERGELDGGADDVVPHRPLPIKTGGAAVKVLEHA